MYDVVFVSYPSNKSTTWHFKKFKVALKFMKSLREVGDKGYYVLCFTIQGKN